MVQFWHSCGTVLAQFGIISFTTIIYSIFVHYITVWRNIGTVFLDIGLVWHDIGTVFLDIGLVWHDIGSVWRDIGTVWYKSTHSSIRYKILLK
ncbi:hypothetical protein TSAR_011037 [Trichomalopsis sarcophagae]|uniref:Uncharacterized protein n=1 Tax=Trichomalopsis sarcophagae TaxID=543379 RepID=A0A232EFX1_9HYME|nr:hypothetical protein TSAR_011037 [Trichomalopsis sarcophagae]